MAPLGCGRQQVCDVLAVSHPGFESTSQLGPFWELSTFSLACVGTPKSAPTVHARLIGDAKLASPIHSCHCE